MKTFLSFIMAAGMALAFAPANAQTGAGAPAAKPHAKKAVKKAAKKEAEPAVEDDPVPDLGASSVSEYKCPEGQTITVYRNASDEKHAAMRWNKQLYGMRRIQTESGAERLESRKYGLVFIGIPAKTMLFDSKKGQQLANDCVLVGQ